MLAEDYYILGGVVLLLALHLILNGNRGGLKMKVAASRHFVSQLLSFTVRRELLFQFGSVEVKFEMYLGLF